MYCYISSDIALQVKHWSQEIPLHETNNVRHSVRAHTQRPGIRMSSKKHTSYHFFMVLEWKAWGETLTRTNALGLNLRLPEQIHVCSWLLTSSTDSSLNQRHANRTCRSYAVAFQHSFRLYFGHSRNPKHIMSLSGGNNSTFTCSPDAAAIRMCSIAASLAANWSDMRR